MAELTTQKSLRTNLNLLLLGVGALATNKVRYGIGGYRQPRPYGNDQIETVIDYSFATVEKMCSWSAAKGPAGRRILELGPGDNLCVGLILLAQGATSYDAADINDLALVQPGPLYDRLFERMETHGLKTTRARDALDNLNRGPLRYHVLEEFDLRLLAGREYDTIWSQAAFEHFIDPVRSIGQLDALAGDGCELGVEIDLMTHTRALRQTDPLNIYRVPGWLYRLLEFSGIPNRYRTEQYVAAVQASGWLDVATERIAEIPEPELERVRPWLARRFQEPDYNMGDLVVVIRASRGPIVGSFELAA